MKCRIRLSATTLLAFCLILSALFQFTWIASRVQNSIGGSVRNDWIANKILNGAVGIPAIKVPHGSFGDQRVAGGTRKDSGLWKNDLVRRRARKAHTANHNGKAGQQKKKNENGGEKAYPRKKQQDRHQHQQVGSREEAKKGNSSHRVRWDPGMMKENSTQIPLKVNLPIFLASLPKSGTTSIWQYFNCGGHQASHQWIKSGNTTIQTGQCIRNNVQANRPTFQGCGDKNIFTDTGFANYKKGEGSDCYYPSVDALDSIAHHYPTATIILVVRNTSTWLKSMKEWGQGSLLDRWRPCNATGFPSFAARDQEFEHFYEWHTENLQSFVRRHPSINYIELKLESLENGKILEERIGIPARCWGICSPSSKFCKPVLAQ